MSAFQYGPRQYLSRRLRSAASSAASGGVESRSVASVELVASVECHASVDRSASARSREMPVVAVASGGVRSVLCAVGARLRQVASVSRSVASQSVVSVLRQCSRLSLRACQSVASRETSPSSPRSVLVAALTRSRQAAAQSRSERIGRRLAGLGKTRSVASVRSASVAFTASLPTASVSRSRVCHRGGVAACEPHLSAAPKYLQ